MWWPRSGSDASLRPSAVITGLVPVIPLWRARPCVPKRDGRVKPGHDTLNFTLRLALALASSLLLAGCFQPIYGEHSIGASKGVKEKLAAVVVPPVNVPNGTALARVSVHMRNALLFKLTGGGPTPPPAYTLKVVLVATQQQVIVDVTTNRPEIENYGINASYSLVDNATHKTVMTAQTFARASYNIPGQEQRFAGARGLRDAENRAADVIADNIHARLVSYFVAGT